MFMSDCLSIGSSSIMPLPWPIAQSCLRVITIIIIIIIIITPQVGKPPRTIDLPGIVDHFQLEVPSKLSKLLMILYSGLDYKRRQC